MIVRAIVRATRVVSQKLRADTESMLPAHLRGRAYLWLYVFVAATALSSVGLDALNRLTQGEEIDPGFAFDERACAYKASTQLIVPGDCVISANGQEMADGEALMRFLASLGPDRSLILEIERQSGRLVTVALESQQRRTACCGDGPGAQKRARHSSRGGGLRMGGSGGPLWHRRLGARLRVVSGAFANHRFPITLDPTDAPSHPPS